MLGLRLLLSLYLTFRLLAPTRGIQLSDQEREVPAAVLEPVTTQDGGRYTADSSNASEDQFRAVRAWLNKGGADSYEYATSAESYESARLRAREVPAPVLEPVRTQPGWRYTADSVDGNTLVISQDQFMYSFPPTGPGIGYGREFPSAWLMTRDRFLQSVAPPETWRWHNIELNILNVLGWGQVFGHTIPMPIDFFNFMGVHLSFWADAADIRGAAREAGSARAKVKEYFEDRLSNDIARFQEQASALQSQSTPLLSKETVALLPFALGKDRQGARTAEIMLNATFWSLKSQFDAVVLGACHPDDYEFLTRFPAWRVIQLNGTYCSENGGMYLLGHALKALEGASPDSDEWKRFNYVYFTEGDMVLYLREHERISEHLKSSGGALIPHRLNTFPATKDFPEALREDVQNGSDRSYFDRLDKTSTPVSTVTFDEVSCCFSGRVRSGNEFWWSLPPGVSAFPLLKSAKLAGDALPITLASQGGPEVCDVSRRNSCR